MLLQLAFDTVSLDEALDMLGELAGYIDIVEAGTPFILHHGIRSLEFLKRSFPQLLLLADLKIADAGAYEAAMAFDCGADIVTVLAAMENSTISGVVEEAQGRSKKVMADMMGVCALSARAAEADALGVDFVCAHTGYDGQSSGQSPLQALTAVRSGVRKALVAVAGGVNLSNIDAIVRERPDVVVVGGAVTNAAAPLLALKAIRERLEV